MDVDQFINQTNNTHVDEDGYYGAQCWDLVARYARVVVGCPSFPTGSGGAEGLFRLFQNPIPQYFDRIANNTSDPNQLPQKGDVIVWQASFSPPYGHTALVISANSAGVTVLEQNGNNPGGNAYIKTRNWVGVSGWLRPKTQGEAPMQKQDIINFCSAVFMVNADAEDLGHANQPWHDVMYYLAGKYQQRLHDIVKQKEDYFNIAETRHSYLEQIKAHVPGAPDNSDDVNGLVAAIVALEDAEKAAETKVDELVKSNDLKDQRIADLQKQVPGSTEVEQPVVTPDKRSLWQVIGDFLSQFKKG